MGRQGGRQGDGSFVLKTTDPQGNSVVTAYDLLNNPLNVIDKENGEVNYTYDGLARVKNMTAMRNGKEESISYLYNNKGAISEMTDSSGTTNYQYDGLGQLKKEIKDGIVKNYTYDNNGNRKTFTLGTDINTTYNYDSLNRLTSIIKKTRGRFFCIILSVGKTHKKNGFLLQTKEPSPSHTLVISLVIP